MKRSASIMAMLLACSLSLTACGSSSSSTTATSTASASTSVSTSVSSGYTFRTSDSNRVVTENGTFSKGQAESPILITAIGQSADASMLEALMKKVGAEFTFNSTASAEEAANYKTIILVSGASSKGLGAAGISTDDELARAEAIAKVAKENDITVIAAHLGGAARRGTLSDQFNDLALGCASYVLVVEEGNDDGKFTDAAASAGIPITLVYSIADAMTPLTDIFG